jgi:hypothetical protein
MPPLNIFHGWSTSKWQAYLSWNRTEGSAYLVRNRFISRAFLIARFEQHWTIHRLIGTKA